MIDKELVNEIKKRLVKTYDPLAIYLFGSYAWGTPDDDSDLDLLVVVEQSNEKPHHRVSVASEALWDLKVPKDIFIYTKEEFKQRVKDSTTLCHKVERDGKVLYARA